MAGIPGLGLSSPLGLGVDGDRVPWLSAPSASNPNLLTFPEDFDNSVWLKVGVAVTANPGGSVRPGADGAVFSGGTLREVSDTAATSGSGASVAVLSAGSIRYSVTATIDSKPYTWSCEIEPQLGSDGLSLQLQLAVVGGFIAVTIRDLGDNPSVFLFGAKLEQSASFSQYP